jgi:hypothetical protein
MNEFEKFMAIQAAAQSEYLCVIAWVIAEKSPDSRASVTETGRATAQNVVEHAPSFVKLFYKER